MIPQRRLKCIECGEALTLEMERDECVCVQCQSERWPSLDEIMEARAQFGLCEVF